MVDVGASKFFPICMDFPVGFELGRQGVQLSFQSRLGIWVCVSAALSNSLLYTSELAGRLRNSRGFVQKWWISMGFTWNLGDTAFLPISIHFYPFLSICLVDKVCPKVAEVGNSQSVAPSH